MASITVSGSNGVKYDGRTLYPRTDPYSVEDTLCNYKRAQIDVAAGNITITTPFTNVLNMTEQYISVIADMTKATWNTVGKHETFAITGAVRMKLMVECTDTLTDAADLAVIQFGHESDTAAFIAATNAAGKSGTTISTGVVWCDTTPAEVTGAYSTVVLDKVINGGLDVGYEITGAALTGGVLKFHCWWTPLNATGAVAAGTGASL